MRVLVGKIVRQPLGQVSELITPVGVDGPMPGRGGAS